MRARRPPDADQRPPDYAHRLHAGNVGDVWKHCALVEVLGRVAGGARVRYVDTHAGEGSYPLGATGEWTEGVGRLWPPRGGRDAAGRWLALLATLAGRDARPRRYPGSPALAAALLRPDARLLLWERDPATHARLVEATAGDRRVVATCGDGLAALADAAAAAERDGGEAVALVDPPWTSKTEWTAVPDALARAVRATTRARFLLWYPVKSLTRPNAMLARLADAGVAATVAELVTTPLEEQRNRLNGSGVLLVRPPDGAVGAIAAAAPVLGAACATHPQTWSSRVKSWGA
jgi:23S rRNA (adenine2030-N6)-methyltransferase